MGVKWRMLLRRRVFEPDQLDVGNLKRCLSVWDLTALGVGSSLGVGIYVLVGSVALTLAGPSIVLSFIIAAVAAIFAAMCYAELGSRVPKAGSAYIYTYVTVGEIVAFFVGWNMILETVFGTASVARGLSMYVDSMTNHAMSSWLESVVPIYAANFSPYFDFFSFFVVVFLGALLAIGVRESTFVNNLLTILNILVIAFIISAGAFKADSSNWNIPAAEVPAGRGVGGFFPYGVWGMVRGAAVCFYGFVGFDSISSTGEEVRNPRTAIPTSIMVTQVIVFLAYAGVATVVTMMMPYYLQEKVASVATAFSYAGWDWARAVVTAGAIVGIATSLYGSMFPLPRLLYSMASDGLLFHWLSRLTENRKSPTIATLLSTVVIALLAAILELNELILMMCIGTLLAYTIVASCVILLRYRSSAASEGWTAKQIVGLGQRFPNRITSNFINILLLLFICTCVSSALVASLAARPLAALVALHVAAALLLVVMALQPQNNEDIPFKTPLVPFIPGLSIYVNIHLMLLIRLQSWIRVLIWIAIGIPVYIFCMCYYEQKANVTLENNINGTHANANEKPPVQIYVVSPTPPDTIGRSNRGGRYEHEDEIQVDIKQNIVRIKQPIITEEIIVQHALIEENEEKEANIIDLLDQVLQAEEESYGEIKEQKEEVISEPQPQETTTHIKLINELSDAEPDASKGINQELSKYDVIAQVHREDLPKLTEEEKSDKDTETSDNENGDQEEVTAFNDSDANSRTDESGYSDTLDKTVLGESMEDFKEEISNIPVPPPLDENFFASPAFKISYTISGRLPKKQTELEEKNKSRESDESNNSYDDASMVFGSDKQMHCMSKSNIPVPPPLDENFFASPAFKKSYTISGRLPKNQTELEEKNQPRESVESNNSYDDASMVFGSDKQVHFISKSNIPVPPPLDENFFAGPAFKKSYTISVRPPKRQIEQEEKNKPRESLQSNNSYDDAPMVFGSDKQMHFMSKLENIFQSKIANDSEDDTHRRRSNSTGNAEENANSDPIQERPAMFFDLKKEIMSRQAARNLRHVDADENKAPSDDEKEEETVLSREVLISKLEHIFSASGPRLSKRRLMTSNPPTPEEAYHIDGSSIESIPKIPKKEKNDTLKRQKAKYGEVLNSLRMMNNEDQV